MSAEIIAFPPRPDPNERVARALKALDTALAQQREAVSQWRTNLADLASSAGSLTTSLALYCVEIEGLDQRNRSLAREISRLNQTLASLP